MSHHLGFLYFDDGIEVREIINHARTIEHLRNSGISCATIGIVGDECPVLYLDQCDYTPITFTTPDALTNPAPWNEGTGTPSADGYGFWIDEWTGLDSAHIRRGATAKYPIGSTFGPLGQSHRVWKMNVKLFGANGAALEDLFRWLEESLIQCCSPGVTAWIRTTCPEGYGNDYGLVHVIDAQLLEGPEWLSPPVEELGCIMRLVSFTIGVGDPCLYRPPVQCLDEDVFPAFDNAAVVVSTGASVTATGDVEFIYRAPETYAVGGIGYTELIWGGFLDDWTPAATQTLISHGAGTNPDFGLRLEITTAGNVRLLMSSTGASHDISATSTATVLANVTPGVIAYIRARRSAQTGNVNFAISADQVTWTQIGATVATTAGGWTSPRTAPVEIGATEGGFQKLIGTTAFAAIYYGSADEVGTTRLRFDPESARGETTWFDGASGITWTLGASGVTFGTDPNTTSLCSLGLGTMFGCPDDENAFADYRLCCSVAGERIGVIAPVVVIRNDGTSSFSPPMRVVGITDNGSGCLVANNEIFGEVRISGIPPQSELMIDCARRRVLWRPVGFIRPWEPGYVYLDRSIDAVPDYPAVGCNDALIFIEPTAITPSLADLKVNAWMVGRYGCC